MVSKIGERTDITLTDRYTDIHTDTHAHRNTSFKLSVKRIGADLVIMFVYRE